MGLLDDLTDPPVTIIGRVEQLLENELSAEERVAVLEALEKIRENHKAPGTHPGYSVSWLERVLKANGHQVGETSIRRWLKGYR